MATNLTNDQFFKLPKWAQNEINRLSLNNEHLQKKMDAMMGEGETNTVIISGMDKKPLPNNSTVRFSIEEEYVEARVNKSLIQIRSSNYNSKMVLRPQSTNVFEIGFTVS